jgi:hypothetical protein
VCFGWGAVGKDAGTTGKGVKVAPDPFRIHEKMPDSPVHGKQLVRVGDDMTAGCTTNRPALTTQDIIRLKHPKHMKSLSSGTCCLFFNMLQSSLFTLHFSISTVFR